MCNGFSPQVLWQLALGKKGSSFLKKSTVKVFSNSIVFWGVMSGKPSLSSMNFQVIGKFNTQILSTSIRLQPLYPHTMLSLCPCFKLLVRHKSLVLGSLELQVKPLGAIINEGAVVGSSIQGLDW